MRLTLKIRNGKRSCRNSKSPSCHGIRPHRHQHNRCRPPPVTENHRRSQPQCLATETQCPHHWYLMHMATKDLASSRNPGPTRISLCQVTTTLSRYLKALRMVVATISRDNVLLFTFNNSTALERACKSTSYSKDLLESLRKLCLSKFL